MKKKIVRVMLLFVVLCFSYGVVYAETMQLIYDGETHFYEGEPISIYIDGKLTPTTVMPPIQFNGSVVVPAREVFSVMGAYVDWKENEKKVYIEKENDKNQIELIVLEMNSMTAWVNGEIKQLNMPAKLINDKVMVPIRFISEALGYDVKWSASDRTIYIETNDNNHETETDDLFKPNDDVVTEPTLPNEEGELEDENYVDDVLTEVISDYLGYVSTSECVVLQHIEGLNSSQITVEENDKTKQIIVYLNKDYSHYLQAGTWMQNGGELLSLQISHQNQGTQLTLTTSTIKALKVEGGDGRIYLRLVKPSEKYEKIIVLDAGHGAHDPGTTYSGIQEKDLTLSISNAILAKLRTDSNLKVYTTREDDTFLALKERAEFANQIDPDLFISIHINSVDNIPTAAGTETYYTEKADARNKIFATMVQQALVSEFGTKNRGVKANTFVVTKETNAPAILIEIGFLTNESDRAMMLASDFTTRYADIIYQCILQYYAEGYDI